MDALREDRGRLLSFGSGVRCPRAVHAVLLISPMQAFSGAGPRSTPLRSRFLPRGSGGPPSSARGNGGQRIMERGRAGIGNFRRRWFCGAGVGRRAQSCSGHETKVSENAQRPNRHAPACRMHIEKRQAYPAILEKSATALTASRMRESSARRLARTFTSSTLTITRSKKASMGARSVASADIASS